MDDLLAGPDNECWLILDQSVTWAILRNLVTERQTHLHAAGLRAGGTVALRLPPSPAGITTMLAAWRAGAQVTLLDHRLAAAAIPLALSRLKTSPHVGPVDPSRWAHDWPRTPDAGTLDAANSPLAISGRLDPQVSIGGLTADLTVLAGLPVATSTVVLSDKVVMAYVTVLGDRPAEEIQTDLGERPAAYKRPRSLHIRGNLPRTANGKFVRNPVVLRGVARDAAIR
ncbi:AMP-binding protein [Micromonospora sp. NPDC005174]|uniref:AMP-binding protein n=1 Tax=Micromonospora sp. NPDC005174 TaxID=3157018 RepID=UPI0033B14A87